jgi:oligoribonuclease (3'-5' exoribonuclease)
MEKINYNELIDRLNNLSMTAPKKRKHEILVDIAAVIEDAGMGILAEAIRKKKGILASDNY